MRRRQLLAGAVCTALVLFAAGYVGWARLQSDRHMVGRATTGAPSTSPSPMAADGGASPASNPPSPALSPTPGDGGLSHALQVPHLVFLNQSSLGVAPLSDLADRHYVKSTFCDRVYFAAGRGVCLNLLSGRSSGFSVLDGSLKMGKFFDQPGQPTRARISPNGKLASTTVFTSGGHYGMGSFSTQTLITDLETGNQIDLERFTIIRGGQTIQAPDFNFWGVTFASDSDTFYATLATGGTTYLIRGSVRSQTAVTLRDNVECPSLSPDGTRIVYKKSIGSGQWRLHMLDLANMSDTGLAETRSVDDQVEWLDGRHVLYGLLEAEFNAYDIWDLDVENGSSPTQFLAHASSPAVVTGQ